MGDGIPKGFVFDDDIRKKLAGFRMEEDGVIADAVLLQDGLEFRPDGIVAADVFGLSAGIDLHDERFADYGWIIIENLNGKKLEIGRRSAACVCCFFVCDL